MDKLIESILNKKEEPMFNIATVVSLSPFTIKFPPDSTAIPCVATNSLHGIQVNSRVVVIRYKKQFIAMNVIQENVYPIGHTEYIIKPSDTNRSSTTTLTNDPHLTLSLPPKSIYLVQSILFIDGSDSNQDFKGGWSYSNITALTYGALRGISASATSSFSAEMFSEICSISGDRTTGVVTSGWTYRSERFFISTSTNTGSLTLRWAQGTSSATSIVLKQQSSLMAQKIANN